MNALPRMCWTQIEQFLIHNGCAYDPPSKVPGLTDFFHTARFTANVTNVELNLYDDRVSLILGGDRWLPFLGADYPDVEALVADLVATLEKALESEFPWEPAPFLVQGARTL